MSCTHWGINRDAILNGVENVRTSICSHCESDDLRDNIHVSENKLPSYIVPSLQKRFICRHDFGCTFWKLYKNWKKLYD